MKSGLFSAVGMHKGTVKWEQGIKREASLYARPEDIRSEFARDCTRILHCTAYRRLKHKTQVFFATRNDHICTRIEHVHHVASVSYTIANYLGLNTELTNAIALGHDLGHAPFGHAGEAILAEIVSREVNRTFWHEHNSLRFVDQCETLPDNKGVEHNLHLTYAVRDGIVCHCGEVDENSMLPRTEAIDLYSIETPGQTPPFSWEGCVVKIADKISYLGRDIEDAKLLKILTFKQLKELAKIGHRFNSSLKEVNTTRLMHDFILDLCKNSSPQKGISFSEKNLELIKALKAFNYTYIYEHNKLNSYKKYAKLVLYNIYEFLIGIYDGEETIKKLRQYREIYPLLSQTFLEWLRKYTDIYSHTSKVRRHKNEILYDLKQREAYIQAIVDYISGMSDTFAIRVFNEIATF